LTLGGAEHPSIRLLDLRTGGLTHTLIGHERGYVIPVRWSPTQPYLLASGGSDGTVRLWDVRRGKAMLASLDQHNTASRENGRWLTVTNRAHDGDVNGLEFTSDGLHLVSIGHDDKMRVWDLETGLNTLVTEIYVRLLMKGVIRSIYQKQTSDGSDSVYYNARFMSYAIGLYTI
jgi:DNA excision repair protein ERCC-8